MPFETPRLPVENPGEQHLACAILVDTSGSMAPYARVITEALSDLKETICDNDTARGRVEVSVITFDNNVKEVVPFGPVSKMTIPSIHCGGMTFTHQAIEFAMKRVNERKAEYKAQGITYKQPWIWLFTDGRANDADNGSFAALLQAQNESKLNFYGVAVGEEVDEKQLGSMHKNGMILKVSKENFAAAFEFLSKSVSIAANNTPGTQQQLPVPNELTVQFITI